MYLAHYLFLKFCSRMSEFLTKLLNFGLAGLKLGRWAEKEVACEKLSDLLELNFKNK